MALEAQWKTLPLKAENGRPTLLVSTRFTSSAYAVHITDLTNIWSECLDRRAIVTRAFGEDTCIDPSDGENMKSFLKCLRAAMDPAEPNHHLTTLALAKREAGGADAHAGQDGEEDGGVSLTLQVTCEVPRELSATPLIWNMYLERAAPSALTTELVLPLIEVHRADKARVQSLVDIIQQKDAVITRLIEKSGVPLDSIFTALKTKRKLTREQAEARVKGLAAFDREKWNAGMARTEELAHASSLVESAFAHGLVYNPNLGPSHVFGDWWLEIGSPESIRWHKDQEPSRQAHQAVQGHSEPRKAAGSSLTNPIPVAEDDDGDSDGLDSVPVRPRLGKIGGTAMLAGNVAPSNKRSATGDGSATTSDDEDGDVIAASSDKKRPRTSPGGKKPIGRIGLGVVGGKAWQAASRSVTRSPSSPPPDDRIEDGANEMTSPRGRVGRIGRIGTIGQGAARNPRPDGKGSDDGDGTESGDEEPVKEHPRPAPPPVEKKPVARPAKKKRKF
jgi:hypothetical protein